MSQGQEYIIQIHNTLDVPATVVLSQNGPSKLIVNSGQWLQYSSSTPFTALHITAPSSNAHPAFRHNAMLFTNTFNQGCFTITPTAVVRSSASNSQPTTSRIGTSATVDLPLEEENHREREYMCIATFQNDGTVNFSCRPTLVSGKNVRVSNDSSSRISINNI